jgi:hypothetical protein
MVPSRQSKTVPHNFTEDGRAHTEVKSDLIIFIK